MLRCFRHPIYDPLCDPLGVFWGVQLVGDTVVDQEHNLRVPKEELENIAVKGCGMAACSLWDGWMDGWMMKQCHTVY